MVKYLIPVKSNIKVILGKLFIILIVLNYNSQFF